MEKTRGRQASGVGAAFSVTTSWRILIMLNLYVLSFSISSPAQTCLFNKPISATDKSFLQQTISRDWATSTVLRAAFEQQKKVKALSRPLTSKGTFLLANGLGLAWRVSDPFPSDYVLVGAWMIQDDLRGHREAMRVERMPFLEDLSTALMSMYTGHLEAMAATFALYDLQQDKDLWQVGLKPLNSQMTKVMTSMCIKGKGSLVTEVLLQEPSGDETRILFRGHTLTSTSLSEDEENVFHAP